MSVERTPLDLVTAISMVLAVVAIGFSVLYAMFFSKGIKLGSRAVRAVEARDPAVRALRERYGRGEITKEQFEEALAALDRDR